MIGATFTASPIQMMIFWEQLVECRYGVSSFGGDVCEVFAYNLMPYSPHVMTYPKGKWARQDNAKVNRLIHELCSTFADRHNVIVEFANGTSIDALLEQVIDPVYRIELRVREKVNR